MKLLCKNEMKVKSNERIQDVDWDLSSNTFPSLLEELEDNFVESLVSILHLYMCLFFHHTNDQ
jgi:hypothetical protein